jgi:hypothetical protein
MQPFPKSLHAVTVPAPRLVSAAMVDVVATRPGAINANPARHHFSFVTERPCSPLRWGDHAQRMTLGKALLRKFNQASGNGTSPGKHCNGNVRCLVCPSCIALERIIGAVALGACLREEATPVPMKLGGPPAAYQTAR